MSKVLASEWCDRIPTTGKYKTSKQQTSTKAKQLFRIVFFLSFFGRCCDSLRWHGNEGITFNIVTIVLENCVHHWQIHYLWKSQNIPKYDCALVDFFGCCLCFTRYTVCIRFHLRFKQLANWKWLKTIFEKLHENENVRLMPIPFGLLPFKSKVWLINLPLFGLKNLHFKIMHRKCAHFRARHSTPNQKKTLQLLSAEMNILENFHHLLIENNLIKKHVGWQTLRNSSTKEVYSKLKSKAPTLNYNDQIFSFALFPSHNSQPSSWSVAVLVRVFSHLVKMNFNRRHVPLYLYKLFI